MSWAQRLLMAVIKLFLVAAGAVLALVVLCGVLMMLAWWAVRRTWARLTGRPVQPWVLRTDPMALWRQAAGFGRAGSAFDRGAFSRGGFARGAFATGVAGAGRGAGAGHAVEALQERRRAPAADVTDVTPKG